MNQQHQDRQNKSLPPSLFKTATQITHTHKDRKEKPLNTTFYQPFSSNVLNWNESSTSLTRDKAPCHRIPKAERFHTLNSEPDYQPQTTILQFLRTQTAKNQDKHFDRQRGVSFARSQRPEHFIRVNSLNPSPSAYSQQRFMDETHYKTQNSRLKTETTFQSYSAANRNAVRGIQFAKFQNYHKSFVDHCKHRPYQPEDTMRNPGPGFYKPSFANKKRQIRYSFQKALSRFNQQKEMKPGPAAYQVDHKRVLSFNAKGTIPKSKREYLTKFQPVPGPNEYAIARFLEDKPKH